MRKHPVPKQLRWGVAALSTKLHIMENLGNTDAFREDLSREDSFRELYHELYAPVYYFACRFVEREDAADLTADAFLKLWKSRWDLASPTRAKTFLQVTVRNAAVDLDRHKKVSRRAGEAMRYLSTEGEEMGLSIADTKALLVQQLFTEIDRLPLRCRETFRMAYLEGMRERDIAIVQGVSPHTVRAQMVKALATLRLRMKRYEWAL